MKITTKLGVVLCAAAAFGYADSYTGKLLDASCHDRSTQPNSQNTEPNSQNGQGKDASASCAATQTTTSFAVQTADGKVYKLDASGNAKASTFMQGHADSKQPTVTVSGSADGNSVKVDSIDMK